MSLEIYTLVHVLISVAAMFAGFGFLAGVLAGRIPPRWTAVFLILTAATSLTGFFFPFVGFTPAYVFGGLSIALLAVAAFGLYSRKLAGGWRKTFVITAILSLYLNVFVLIAQFFLRLPALHALAPTQTEPAFGVTQGILLVVFIALIVAAVKRLAPTSA